MDIGDIRSWLRLSRLELAPRVAVGLIQHFGSPDAVFTADDAQLANIGILSERVKEKLRLPVPAAIEKDLQLIEKINLNLLPITSENYPAPLKEIFDPPILLYVRGELLEKDKLAIGIVGSRKASPYGRAIAERLAKDLSSRGLAIISGGARGIDTCAHRGALAGGGRTVAVLGCGVDVNYPSENQQLFDTITGSGAVISEFPLGSQPEPWRFPPRNRLISGLSIGVLVCQSPESSGALITAGYAAEQGRDVYAVPGNVDDERNRGCHKLIKDGAKLVENADDILAELGISSNDTDNSSQPSLPLPILTDQESKIVSLLSLDPVAVDDIIDKTGLPAHVISGALTLLEMRGVIKRLPGHTYVRSLL
jgi:DNA processing protein